VFEIRNWTVPHPVLVHKNALENISLSVHKGEIVGLGGLMGAGRTELALSILGLYEKPAGGEIFIDGKKEKIGTPTEAIDKGLCYLTEDRKGRGLILNNSIKKNITLASLKQFSRFSQINFLKEEEAVRKIVNDLTIKASSLEQEAANLSGGNQQKVVLAKWLMAKPKILILDEPTRGIDVGAKFEIYELMNRLTAEGLGILMISSELPELLGVCDRIVIMHEGELTGELDRSSASPELFMKYATGGR
jgi:D-xylose transport system ATP-binding protein